MKIRVFGATSAALIALLASAQAGEPPAKEVILEEEASALSWELSTGYDTEYVFRGVSYTDDLLWGQVALDYGITDSIGLWLGVWYAGDTSDGYREFDAMAELYYEAETFTLGLAFNFYEYNSDELDESEIGLNLTVPIGETPLSAKATYFYDLTVDGHYLYGGLEWESEITDKIGLQVSAGLSYNGHYFTERTGLNNADIRVTLPLSLTESLSVAPYAAVTIPLEVLEADSDTLAYGGVQVTLAF